MIGNFEAFVPSNTTDAPARSVGIYTGEPSTIKSFISAVYKSYRSDQIDLRPRDIKVIDESVLAALKDATIRFETARKDLEKLGIKGL